MNTPPEIRNVPLTVDEAKVLLQLIDAAVKALGLNAAEAAAVLAKKVNAAFLEGPVGNNGADGVAGVQARA